MNLEDENSLNNEEHKKLKALFERGSKEYALLMAALDVLIETMPGVIKSQRYDKSKFAEERELSSKLQSNIDVVAENARDRILNLKNQFQKYYQLESKSEDDYKRMDNVRMQLENALVRYNLLLLKYIKQDASERTDKELTVVQDLLKKLKNIQALQNPTNPHQN